MTTLIHASVLGHGLSPMDEQRVGIVVFEKGFTRLHALVNGDVGLCVVISEQTDPSASIESAGEGLDIADGQD